jgi:hypothetical protein
LAKRKAIPKKLRFEVFKRDSFACQYCGRKAPEVILEIDHIKPHSKGGTDDLLNLVTACEWCNSGKSDRPLSDDTVVEKQRRQLEELQERREQLEMMFEWQRGLLSLDEEVIVHLSDFWCGLAPPFRLTGVGLQKLRKLVRQYPVDEIADAMKKAAAHYVEWEEKGPAAESVEEAWSKIPGILSLQRAEGERPYLKDIFYVRGILRNRLHYFDKGIALSLLTRAVEAGVDVDYLKQHAKEVCNWTEWRNDIDSWIESALDG